MNINLKTSAMGVILLTWALNAPPVGAQPQLVELARNNFQCLPGQSSNSEFFALAISRDNRFAVGTGDDLAEGGLSPAMRDLQTGSACVGALPLHYYGLLQSISHDGRYVGFTVAYDDSVNGVLDRSSGTLDQMGIQVCSDGTRMLRAFRMSSQPVLASVRTINGDLIAEFPISHEQAACPNLIYLVNTESFLFGSLIGAISGDLRTAVLADTLWREGVETVSLRTLFPPDRVPLALALSEDGRTIIGVVREGSACVTGFQMQIGEPPQYFSNFIPGALSAHAEVVLGNFDDGTPQYYFWGGVYTSVRTPKFGEQTSRQFIDTVAPGLIPTADIVGIQAVSPDGRTLIVATISPTTFERHEYSIRLPGNYLCDSIDFNNDGLTNPDDIAAFLSRYSEGPCVPESATCNDINFNNDTSLFDPEDINAFLRVYSEGPCMN